MCFLLFDYLIKHFYLLSILFSAAPDIALDLLLIPVQTIVIVYTEDGEVVPKNSSIVVRRVPSRNSLVSRLNSRGMMHGHGHAAAAM